MQINSTLIALILSISIICFILAGIISVLTYAYHLKKSGLENQLNLTNLSTEKLLLKTQFEIQEAVIQQISREIHDNINLSLTLAKMNLQKSSNSDLRVAEPIELITESINKLNNISKTYSSEIINEYGLLRAIEIESERVSNSSYINIEITQTGEPVFLCNEKEIILFRIVQECLNNIIRHSQANSVSINITYTHSELALGVIDNGIGIDLQTASQSSGLGLRNLKSRTKHLNGELSITSSKNSGTLVQIKIPLNEPKL